LLAKRAERRFQFVRIIGRVAGPNEKKAQLTAPAGGCALLS
jgi:hypothetical protein